MFEKEMVEHLCNELEVDNGKILTEYHFSGHRLDLLHIDNENNIHFIEVKSKYDNLIRLYKQISEILAFCNKYSVYIHTKHYRNMLKLFEKHKTLMNSVYIYLFDDTGDIKLFKNGHQKFLGIEQYLKFFTKKELEYMIPKHSLKHKNLSTRLELEKIFIEYYAPILISCDLAELIKVKINYKFIKQIPETKFLNMLRANIKMLSITDINSIL